MSSYKALTVIHHNGKRYAVGDVLQLSDADAKRMPHAVELVGAAKAEPVKPAVAVAPSPAVTPPNNPDKTKVKK